MKYILFLLVGISSFVYGQSTKFKTDSIEVYDISGKIKRYKCETTFTYTNRSFMLFCKDRRVYDFLIPGTSFMDLDILVYDDTGYSVNMNDSTMNISRSKHINFNTGTLYESKDGYIRSQIVQYVDTTGIYLIKKDKTKIKFK